MITALGGVMIWRGEAGKENRDRDSDKSLERQVDELLARAAAVAQDYEAGARYRNEALAVVRVLVGRHPGDLRHLGALAGGLYNLSNTLIQSGRWGEATATLAEARRHYAVLAKRDPRTYGVRLCDVMLRIAFVHIAGAEYAHAASAAQQALDAYQAVADGDDVERDFGIVRAHTAIGQAYLLSGNIDGALEEFDAALFIGERLREEAGITGTASDWLARAPESFRQAAPVWLGAAVGAMTLHDAAGRWSIAADAANIAMRLAGGLAAIGGDEAHRRFEAVHEQARQIWWAAKHPLDAAFRRRDPADELVVSLATWFENRG